MRPLLIVGDGPVARAFAAGLERAGAPPLRWWRRRGGPLPAAEVVVLAVSDDAIAAAATAVMTAAGPAARVAAAGAPPIFLHCAGALPADEPFAALAPRPSGIGLLHPLVSLAGGADDAEILRGAVFAVQGDRAGRDAALEIVALLGGAPFELPPGEAASARYHAAAALVSNHSVGLVAAGVELLCGLGLDRARATRALAALLASTARNLAAVGLPDALTGPIARGDAGVVARHLGALDPHDPLDLETAALYRATARPVTKVAAQKGRAGDAALARIRGLIGDGD